MDNKKCVLLVPLQRLSKEQKTYTKGILRVYDWRGSAIGYRTARSAYWTPYGLWAIGDEARRMNKQKKKDWRAIYIINHNH